MLLRLLLAIVTLTTPACGDRLSTISPSPVPLAPTTPSPAPKPTPAGERWNLTRMFSTFTGPEACSVYTAYIGEAIEWSMAVTRASEGIHLVVYPPDENFYLEYDGTVVSDILTAARKDDRSQGRVCDGSRVRWPPNTVCQGASRKMATRWSRRKSCRFNSAQEKPLVFSFNWSATPKV